VVLKTDDQSVHLGTIPHFLCAAQAGFVSVLMTNPVWMVKTRLQIQLKDSKTTVPYRNFVDCFVRIVREEGPLSLYRGLTPALTLVSNGALQFAAYEKLKRFAANTFAQGNEKNLHPGHYLVMGAMAKVFSSSLTYPLQVTRSRLYQRKEADASTHQPPSNTNSNNNTSSTTTTRTRPMTSSSTTATMATTMQARSLHSSGGLYTNTNSTIKSALNRVDTAKYRDMGHVVKHILQHESWRSFYRGLVPHLMKTAPSSAITFTSYETVLKLIDRASHTKEPH
jgi:hypothetical protein